MIVKMKAPSGGGRAAVRSIGKLLERRCWQFSSAVSAPELSRNYVRPASEVIKGGKWLEGRLQNELRLMRNSWPATTVAASLGRQLQPERGFLGIGDGDEDIGLSKHFEQDRIIGYV